MPSATAKFPAQQNFKDNMGSFLFVLPAVAIFAVFYIYPFFEIFRLSLHEWNGISAVKTFIGFDNFIDLTHDGSWWKSMGNAAYITLIALTFQNILALGLALACHRKIRLKGFYRLVFFVPPILSEIVVGLIWRWILNSGEQAGQAIGLFNYFLIKTGFGSLVHSWLSDPNTALTCIAVVHSWKGFGWGFVMFYAGLQTIDQELYEAARVDGASSWSVFWNITFPLMLPVIMVVVILTILGSMQSFVLILAMVAQGLGEYTSVPGTRILSAMIGMQQYGYACSQGVTFGVILVIVSFALKKLSDRMQRV